jgi:putative aldouronate transport system substrate-binding protein
MKVLRNATKSGLLLLLAVLLAVVSACSGGNNSGNGSHGKPDNEGSIADGNADASNPHGKYDPPITVTTVRDQDPSMAFKPGEDWDKNSFTRAYLDELGIIVEHDWIVPSDQYEAKMNISISSGQLPDIFRVNAAQLAQLVEADLVEDLTDVYEQYASELLRKSIDLGPQAKQSAMFDGRLMAIPPGQEGYEGSLQMLWVRTDWLNKLGLKAPTTFAELEHIVQAFTEDDPDGNGADDTHGIGLTKDLYGNGVSEATAIFNAFHAWPNIWIEDREGKLVYGGIQPEVKAALGKMQEWYKKGYIHREFGVKDGGKIGEDAASGKVGLQFGALWNSLWPLQDSVSNDRNADWMPLPIVSVDDRAPQYESNLTFDTFNVVRKGYEHPEAIIKLANLGHEKLYSGEHDAKVYHTEMVGDKEYKHFREHVLQAVGSNPTGGNYVHYQKVTAALDSGDPSGLDQEQKGYFDKILQYNEGDRSTWGTMRVFGHESAYKMIDELYKDKDYNIKFTQFIGAPTPTMIEKKSTLDKIQLETFTKIILGDPLDSFEKFASDWKKLGGDAMAEEVNAWYASQD